MLFNQERAHDILEREQLDALIAVRPINVYYLSDYWGLFNTPGGYDAAYLALATRDAAAAALIVPALELRRVETLGTWMPNLFGFSSPADEGSPEGIEYTGWRPRAGADLTDIEQAWLNVVDRHGRDLSANAFHAVARAIAAAGCARGRIATDDARLAGWLAACGLDAIDCRYRVDLFNEIRLIKTADELELLRTAARCNERGLLTAADSMTEGATWPEIEDVYMAAMARQGARGVYLTCGVGGLPAGRVRRGEPVLFDALGQYAHYHGDFGRCVVAGEPSAEHRRRHRAICTGWDAAQDYLKPGIRYSEISRAVGDVIRREGFSGFRDPIVHSLGLEHTDDPKYPGVQPQDKPDQILAKNMVVNVDMPHTEFGWGSVHMEDTVVITGDGCERLASADFGLRVVG